VNEKKKKSGRVVNVSMGSKEPVIDQPPPEPQFVPEGGGEAEELEHDTGRVTNLVDEADEPEFPDAEATNSVPSWVKIPDDLKIPRGTSVGFMKFPSRMTVSPQKGDRQVVIWTLTDLDERVAYDRVQHNVANAANELAKQMIRAIDGVKVNWAAKRGDSNNIHEFWRDIGPKCRHMLVKYYSSTHAMDVEEVTYFLENCVAVRTMT
tara:strand:- start:94 stop:714 length:621 start_codon:yes stop_codon:yes gene_type:complete